MDEEEKLIYSLPVQSLFLPEFRVKLDYFLAEAREKTRRVFPEISMRKRSFSELE